MENYRGTLSLELHKRLQNIEKNQKNILNTLNEYFGIMNGILSQFEKLIPNNNEKTTPNPSTSHFGSTEEYEYSEFEPNATVDQFEINEIEHPEDPVNCFSSTRYAETSSGINSMTTTTNSSADNYDADSDDSLRSVDEDPQVMCQDCGKCFIKGSFTDSMAKHLRETSCKPYKCHQCGKGFRLQDTRKRHLLTHLSKRDRSIKLEKNAEPKDPREKREQLYKNWKEKNRRASQYSNPEGSVRKSKTNHVMTASCSSARRSNRCKSCNN